MVMTREPVTETEQCPLYRLLVAERAALDEAIARSANGVAPHFEQTGARARVASMVQEHICRRRAYGERLRPGALSQIEEAVGRLPDDEQSDVLDALASCRAGCTLRR
jgi:hypothetical protein